MLGGNTSILYVVCVCVYAFISQIWMTIQASQDNVLVSVISVTYIQLCQTTKLEINLIHISE